MPTLDALLDIAGNHAKDILITRKMSDLVPAFVLANDAGITVVLCPWANDDEKIACLCGMAELAKRYSATAVSFVGEAWLTDTRSAPDALMIRPSQHPQRREYVIAMAKDFTGVKARQWQIIRDKPGGKIMLLSEHHMEGGEFSGRLLDWFQP